MRWPLYANGRLVGTTVGWFTLLSLASNTEVLAVLQYAAHYWPWLFHGNSLSVGGILVAAGLLAVLTVVNWYGIRLFAPFGQLALLLNLGWLASILYADAVLSPSGSQFVGIAEASRTTYALAKNRLLPKYFLKVDGGSGVPRRALVLNYLAGLLVLIPLHSWIAVVSVIGDVFLLSYAISSVAAGTFRAAAPTGLAGWVPGIKWIAPASFLVSTEIIYWSGWSQIKWALPFTLIGVIVFAAVRTKNRPLIQELRTGAWLALYIVGLIIFSYVGSTDFGGNASIAAPWDSIIVGVLSLALYVWAVREGKQHIERTASLDVDDSPVVSEALSLIAQGRPPRTSSAVARRRATADVVR